MGLYDRDYLKQPRYDAAPKQIRRSAQSRIVKILFSILLGAMVLWAARTGYALMSMGHMQQVINTSMSTVGKTTIAAIQSQQEKYQQQLAEQRKVAELNNLKINSPENANFLKIWINGKSPEDCKKTGVIDNEVVRCMNGYYVYQAVKN